MSTYRLIIVILAAFYLLPPQTQGVRLLKSSEDTGVNTGSVMVNKNGGDRGQAILRSEEGSGTSRELLVQTSTWIPKTTSESFNKGTMKVDNVKGQLNAKASLWRVPGRTRKFKARKYHEDLMDINVMDYTPAKRKTPIHN